MRKSYDFTKAKRNPYSKKLAYNVHLDLCELQGYTEVAVDLLLARIKTLEKAVFGLKKTKKKRAIPTRSESKEK